jgi:nucleotide-binding universal stress UspA family protein
MSSNYAGASTFTIVVGHDFSEDSAASEYAFEQAARVARRIPGSHLHVLHVIDGESSAERTKQLADQLRGYIDETAKAIGGLESQVIGVHVRRGRPAREIAQLAKDVGADLIVVGARKGPHLKQLLVGSVAERLLAAAPCPVFVAGPMPAASDDAHEPVIEPPCSACVDARFKSSGREWWCPRHAEHHAQAHSYSFQRELPLRAHDNAVTPTGVD